MRSLLKQIYVLFLPIALGLSITACSAQSSEDYREITPADGLRVYSRTHMERYEGGKLYEQGFQIGIVCNSGKKLEISLISTNVDGGRVETKDFGVLQIDYPDKLLATESQIKKLLALQSSCQI